MREKLEYLLSTCLLLLFIHRFGKSQDRHRVTPDSLLHDALRLGVVLG